MTPRDIPPEDRPRFTSADWAPVKAGLPVHYRRRRPKRTEAELAIERVYAATHRAKHRAERIEYNRLRRLAIARAAKLRDAILAVYFANHPDEASAAAIAADAELAP